MNYTDLKKEIETYTENTFLPADLDTFITQTEQRIYIAIQAPSLRKLVTIPTVLQTQYVNCPVDFLGTVSLAVVEPTGQSFLLPKDVTFIREAYPSVGAYGTPKYYAVFGPAVIPTELKFILGPTPNASVNLELHYYFYPESITTTASGETWLSQNFSPVLLYGCLVEAYTFMKGEQDVMGLYQGKFQEALVLCKHLCATMLSDDSYRSGQPVQGAGG